MDYYFIFIIILIISTVQSYTLTIEEKDIPVFQPLPSVEINPLKQCAEGQTNSIQTFNLNKKVYVALSVSLCGVNIYDITDLNQVVLIFQEKFNENGRSLMLTISHQQQYLWVGYSTGNFYGIDISQIPFKITAKGNSNTNLLINKVKPFESNNDILFLLCEKEFQIIDWRDKSFGFKFIKNISVNALKATQIEFIKQNQFALVTATNTGIQFYKVQQSEINITDIEFKYLCLIKPNANYDVNNFNIVNESTISIMMNYRGLYMYSIANFLSNNGQSCTSASFKLIFQQDILVGLGGLSYISKNKNFIFTSYRVIGIKIFDISQNSFQLVQSIDDNENSKDIILNESEDLLFFTNSYKLKIFQRIPANFNRNRPNLLLNSYQAINFDYAKETSDNHNDYECIWKESQQLLYITRAQYGVGVFKYSGSGILEPKSYVHKDKSTSYSYKLEFLQDGVTAYLARSSSGFSIIDFSNPDLPSVIKENVKMDSSYVNFTFLKFIKGYKIGLVANQINLLIISIQDNKNPTIINSINTMEYTYGETSLNKFELSQDEKIAYLVVINYGIVVIDLSDLSKPIFKSKFFTDGASDIKLINDEKYAIIAANYKGIIIAKISKDFNLEIISQKKLFGISYRLLVMNNGQYVIVTSSEYPTVSLVNISNLQTPEILQVLENYGKSNSFSFLSMCLSQDNQEVFITALQYLWLMQLKSQMIIHTQIYQQISKENSNEFIRKTVEKDVSLKIGQKIEIHIVPIYQQRDIIIRKVFYYNDFVLQEIPSWMDFKSVERILKLEVSKDSLSKDDQGNYIETVQQIVFLAYQLMPNTVFVNSYLSITNADSQALFDACVKQGYINQNGFIDDSYSPKNEINLGYNENTILSKWTGFNSTLIKNFIKNTLNKNIISYTSQFKTLKSLEVNLNSKNNVIESINSLVVITLTISKNQQSSNSLNMKCRFVKINYTGVIVLYSEKQDEIKIEGNLANINQILSDGIKFFVDETQQDPNNIQIDIVISDSVNYDYENTLSISKLSFIQMKYPVQLSNSESLQNEINNKYTDGKLYIQESFYYQVGEDVFISREGDKLEYIVKIESGGEFEDIPKNFWLSFSSADRIFTGIPLPKNFYEKVKILVNATDGYTFMTDTFEIIPVYIPFSYGIQLALQILGPILGVLGLYRYKYLIYNILNKDSYTYSSDIVYVGEVYKKQITITDNNRKIALKLCEFFLKKIGQDVLKNQLLAEANKLDQDHNYQFIQKQNFKQQQENFQSKINENDEEDALSFESEVKKKMFPFSISPENIQLNTNIRRMNSSQIKSVYLETKDFMNASMNSPRMEQSCLRDATPSQIQNEKIQYKDDSIKQEFGSPDQRSYSTRKKNNSFQKASTNKLNIKLVKNIINSMRIRLKSSAQNMKESSRVNSVIKNQNFIKESQINIFDKNGKINFVSILNFLKDQQSQLPPKKRIVNDDELEQLNNQHSILSQAFYCLLIEFLIQDEAIVKNLLLYLQQKAQKFYREIDWYKAYLDIDPKFQHLKTSHYSYFTINKNTLNAALKEIFEMIGKYYYFSDSKEPKQIKFSLELLEHGIKMKAIGFSHKSPGYLKVTEGESFHCFQYQIHSVKSYEKNNNISCCVGLYKTLDLEFKQKSLSDNERLPSWMQSIDLINGVIIMKGVPEPKDIGNVQFKIVDQNQFVLRLFEIQILEKETEEDKDVNNQPQVLEKAKQEKLNQQQIQQSNQKTNAMKRKNYLQSYKGFSSDNDLKKTRSAISFQNTIKNSQENTEYYFNEDTVDLEKPQPQLSNQLSNFDQYSRLKQTHQNIFSSFENQRSLSKQAHEFQNLISQDPILEMQ